MKKASKMLLLGLISGLINGLLGAGGGILIIKYLPSLLPSDEYDTRDIFAACLCVILPLSAVSLIIYATRGRGEPFAFMPYLLPALLGGFGGALLLERLDTRLLKLIFSALVVWSGISMLF